MVRKTRVCVRCVVGCLVSEYVQGVLGCVRCSGCVLLRLVFGSDVVTCSVFGHGDDIS